MPRFRFDRQDDPKIIREPAQSPHRTSTCFSPVAELPIQETAHLCETPDAGGNARDITLAGILKNERANHQRLETAQVPE